MKSVRKIELLAPAKNAAMGIEAINHGADAVYIGVSQFSARAAAGNSLEEIKKLVEYAHVFRAKVYAALNIILWDLELPAAERWLWDLYRAGVDAVIVQDMGILGLNLPPVPLHASTQTDNRSVEKVQFLEKAGFSRVVLARELSIDEIRTIAAHTSAELEVFVHGALCTSFSGQCYLSQALCGRSANRGECAQYCRLPYTLKDADGQIIATNKHLLSLKDLNQSAYLEELLEAGVCSLKIEGRLKDLSYVKNITAYYRQKLDEIFARRPEFAAASSGATTPFFVPDPQKSFNRGFTSYLLHGRNREIASPKTPKSLGEPVGNVGDLFGRSFTLHGQKPVHNGDGLCFLNEKKELQGFRVNRVEGNKIFPAEMPRLSRGTTLFRNQDQAFEKMLAKKSAERKIAVDLILEENNFGFSLTAQDEDGMIASITYAWHKELAEKNQAIIIQEQFAKLGNTPFVLDQFTNRLSAHWFIPSSVLSEMKRRVIEALLSVRKITTSLSVPLPKKDDSIIYPETSLSYLGNISNEKAKDFYRKHGVEKTTQAFELQQVENVPIFFSKHCLKYQLGYCGRDDARNASTLREPLTLSSGQNRLLLRFDCRRCEMQLIFVPLPLNKKKFYE